MKNLFTLKDLSIEEINHILDLGQEYANGRDVKFENKQVANLFFENSTRTMYSFISAQNRLGINNVDFSVATSSVNKGETFEDTVRTFEALQMDALVIRHSENEYYEKLDNVKIPIINGGDGSGNHPTQSLLDLLTIKQEFGSFEGLKIVIVGDINNSRVAGTNIEVMERLGMEVYTSGPKEFNEGQSRYIQLDEIIESVDIVMLLRVQHERHSQKFSVEEYNERFGLNLNRLDKMKDTAIIMHPAPFNRGVELTDEVVDHKKSRIFKQMENGVYVRSAILEEVLKK